jgi:DNA-binding transcriptional LysR family regulator
MEFRVLRYFLAVVDEKNISRAAQQLHVSQPTVSRQISELEEELETILFERGSRSIELTNSGEYFATQARQILSLTDKTLENIHENQDISGSVWIGSAEAKNFLTVAQAIRELQETYPRIQINVTSTNADDVRARLKSGVFDFGIIMEPADKSDFDFLRIPGESRWGLLVPNTSPLAQKDHLALNDLLGQKLIISQQKGMTEVLNDWFGESNQDIHVVATYNLLYNASLMVSAGVGYALCIDGIVNTNQSELTFVPLKPMLTTGSSIVWLKGHRLSTAAKTLLNQISADLN